MSGSVSSAAEVVVVLEPEDFEVVSEGIQGPTGAQGIPGVADPNIRIECIVITMDAGDFPLTVGDLRVNYVAPFNGTILAWHLIAADAPGDLVVDVWKAAGAKPNGANTITGSEKPTLTNQEVNSDSDLTTWQTAVLKGDIFGFEIESVSGIRKATLILEVSRT